MTANVPRRDSEVEEFAAIVIGSGFGGSVAAHRLQSELGENSGRKVLLLERGMPYPPGSFPRTPRDFAAAFWEPGKSYGLFEMWRFKRSSVLVSSGLGGGSLIYANVLIEKPPDTFRYEDGTDWPLKYEDLERHYAAVKETLIHETLPAAYFMNGDPPAVPKTGPFKVAAGKAGFTNAQRAPLGVTFRTAAGAPAEPGAPLDDNNLHGAMRHTCTLVGECDIGCNEGAKNTLDYTYLSQFKDAEGVIRTCCDAIAVERSGNAWEVEYLQHEPARERVLARGRGGRLLDDEERSVARVRAPVVVLSAGTLGSTRLLLTSRAGLPALSGELGRRFSSNGDMLLFARGCTLPDGRQRNLAPSRGPVITALAHGGPEALGGLWLEDAGGPGISEWGWQAPEIGPDLARAIWARHRELVRGLVSGQRQGRLGWLLGGAFGSAESSSAMLPLLAMGIDRAGGRIRLQEQELALDWDPASSAQHFERAEAAAQKIAKGLGGELWPHSARLRRGYRGLTVHPLGGCPMGKNVREGVVDEWGEVFGCRGLFVCDGSVMPGPVGPNPSLTIAAFAHRIAGRAAEQMIERGG